MKPIFRAIAPIAVAVATPAVAEPPPEAIRAMVDTALATNDPTTIAAVVSVAQRTAPNSAGEIAAMATTYNDRLSAEKAAKMREEQDRIARASPLSLWKGELEVGGSRSTGNSRTLGLYAGANLVRNGIDWSHRITARIDYQETAGAPTTERAVAAYQPQYRLDPVFYVYGLGQYEHDRFLGYRNRFTVGAGAGFKAVNQPKLKIDVDVGPALRRTDFYVLEQEDRLAGRGSFNVRWTPLPNLTLTQENAIYLEKGNTTSGSTTALDTVLFGPLKARFSYAVQYEKDAPVGQRAVDTVGRATLLYGF